MLDTPQNIGQALVAIHDVMPHTLEPVAELLEICKAAAIQPVTLLVVPGFDWQAWQLDMLRSWQASGCILAGHGWQHRCQGIRTFYHWLHSRLLSRDVAEHLSLKSAEIAALMTRCANWFPSQALQSPTLYVPPAWALGRISREAMQQLPFAMIETLTGVIQLRAGEHRRLPLVGFEADTVFRSWFLGRWNAWTTRQAIAARKCLRISLHPFDHRLRLSQSLKQLLSRRWDCLSYDQLIDSSAFKTR